MFQVIQPKVSLRSSPPRTRGAPVARSRVVAPASRQESNAAPLTLAAVVLLGLLLAVTMAIVTALGG